MIVKQAANVLDLLEHFAETGRPASLAEVAQHFGWPRSSTFNLLSTLVARGYLYEPEGRGRFYPTPRWFILAQEMVAAGPLPEGMLRLASSLAWTTGETVCLAGPSGEYAVFLAVVSSPAPVRYATEVGQRMPLHATATGQAILSQFTPSHRQAILRKTVFAPHGETTPMSIDAVEDVIRTSLQRGWFRSWSNFTADLGGVAVPLVRERRIFSITVAGPLYRVGGLMEGIAHTMHDAIGVHLGTTFLRESVPNLATPKTAAVPS